MWQVALAAGFVPEIVGGSETSGWSEVVALLSEGELACSAVRVAPDTLVTAGHCVGTFDAAAPALGEAGVGIVEVVEYPSSWETFDVAVVRLAAPIPGPVARPLHPCESAAIASGSSAWVVGFGADDPYGTSGYGTRRVAEVRISDPDCRSVSQGCQPLVQPGGELVAGGGGVDACVGDSGGALFVSTDDGFRWAGIVSRGTNVADPPCGAGGIYPRVDALWSWLDEHAADLMPPACGNQGPEVSALAWATVVGATFRRRLSAVDPEGDGVRWEVLGAELDAELDDAVIQLRPLEEGRFAVRLRAVDDGEPSESTWVTADLDVQPGCGCTNGSPLNGAATVLAGLSLSRRWGRRRR